MESQKKCLIICYSDLGKDPRVLKHYRALKEAGFETSTAGVSAIGTEMNFTAIHQFNFTEWLNDFAQRNSVRKFLLSPIVKGLNFYKYKVSRRLYFIRYWNFRRIIDLISLLTKNANVDLIIANDIETLPLAICLASGKTKVLYDAHEFHEEQYADKQFWIDYMRPFIIYLNKKYIQRSSFCITIGQNIANQLVALYHVNFEVVLNAPPFENLEPSKRSDSEKIKLVHPGNYMSNRNIEELIVMMNYLPDNYELHFLLVASGAALNQLKEKARPFKNVLFHPPVGVHEVSHYVNQFDIGVALIPATTFNYDNALPNKFFQFIQARLVTAFGPLKEIAAFTKLYNTGIVSEGYTGLDLANAIKKLSLEEINRFKENNVVNSKLFCEENELVKLKKVYTHLMT